MTGAHIILNNVSFHLTNTAVVFDKLNLSFDNLKYGIVGNNGVGKTTFLTLLSGQLKPDSGSIHHSGHIVSVPQSHAHINKKNSVSDVLGVTKILEALYRVNHHCVEKGDFNIMENNWDIEKRIEVSLTSFSVWPIKLEQPFLSLSGGQKTKVLLAKTHIFPADFLLFDEPTNNLDKQSRNIFYDYIEHTNKGMIIVSHDRTLLKKLDNILEISTKGVELYGGNYDFYQEQKAINRHAIQQEIQARKESLTKSKKTVQTRLERHQQNEASGKKTKKDQLKAKGRYNKIELKSKKGRSEGTNRRIRLQAARKLGCVNQQLDVATEKLEVHETIDADLSATQVQNKKMIINIEDLCFSYTQEPLIQHFNLHIIGPERVAITGPNGCGKSTLLKLIRKRLMPQSGRIDCGVDHIAYLDQGVSFLDPELTLVDNFLKCNPTATPFNAYLNLAAFKFRNKDAEKIAGSLSGGEKIRAGLAISLLSLPAPQLMILDEPTNHLDLSAIQAIETIINSYQGAILAVSHDELFLKSIGIKRMVCL